MHHFVDCVPRTFALSSGSELDIPGQRRGIRTTGRCPTSTKLAPRIANFLTVKYFGLAFDPGDGKKLSATWFWSERMVPYSSPRGRSPRRDCKPPTPSAGASRYLLQWLQVVLGVVTVRWSRQLRPWFSSGLAALSLLAASPVGVSGYLGTAPTNEAEISAAGDDEASLGSAEHRQRVVNPVGALPDGSQSAITDVAEEVEPEALSAAARTERLSVPACPTRELSGSRNSYESVGLVDWLRQGHEPRGPPAL